jgi:Bacterial Ig domain
MKSALVIAAVAVAVQAPTPTLKLLSPSSDTYVGGVVLLRAVVEPTSALQHVARVRFFADGNKVCELQRPPFECEWDAGPDIDERTIRVTATFDAGFQGLQLAQTVRTRKLELHERVDVDVVQVPVVVTDGGRFVQGLTRRDFKVFENDVEQPITHFASENIPLELVSALDVSGSMESFMPSMKAAAKRFQVALPPQTPVMIDAFNENVFRPLRSVGRQSGRRAVIIFSDGEDQSSHSTAEAALRRVEGSDATVYTIGQGRAAESKIGARQRRPRVLHAGSGKARGSLQRDHRRFVTPVFDRVCAAGCPIGRLARH